MSDVIEAAPRSSARIAIPRGIGIHFDEAAPSTPAAAETPVTPVVPVTETELTLEQQLEALKPTGHESTPKGGEPAKPGEQVASPATPAAETPDPLLAKLDEIKDDTEEKPKDGEQGKLTPAQQQVLDAVPDVETAQALRNVAEGYQNFASAFQSGKFDDVSTMLETWNPQAYNAFMDHIYTKKVASGEWVDRYITEKDPKTANNPVNKTVQSLQQQIKALQTQVEERTTKEQNEVQATNQQKVVRQYVDHLEGLFDQIQFSPNDRKWVRNDIHARVSENPKLKAAINSGNIAAVNATFKEAVREYVQRDKAVTTDTAAKLKGQEQKKAPIQSGTATQEGALPDDIKAVPKGQEDNWLDQQLGKLKHLVTK